MCYKVLELYSGCGCPYYTHAVDPCIQYERNGHNIILQKVLVKYLCERHSKIRSDQHGGKEKREKPIRDTENLFKAPEDVEIASVLATQGDRQQKIEVNSPVDSTLRGQLLAKFQNIPETDEQFIPAGDLNEVLTDYAIRGELESHGMETCFSFVIQRARIFFAILLAIGRLDAVHHLIGRALGDELLPLASSAVVSLEDDKAQSLLSLLGADTTKEFYEIQWILLAPVFRRGEHLVLLDAARLPIMKTEPIAKGAYGGVHRVKIHPDHLNLEESALSLSQKSPAYALKLFSRGTTDVNKQAFKQELAALRSLRLSGHNHIIKLLASFEQGGRYSMIFPLAEGNLREFWAQKQPSSVESRWYLQQMSGLASALSYIHNDFVAQDSRPMIGVHFDLKPENLLFEAESPSGLSRFVLSDFGVSHFQSKGTEHDLPSHPGTGTYEPPECQLDLPQSRAYDIWSLGCIFLECAAWLMRGSSAIDAFAEDRLQDARASGNSLIDDCFFTLEYDETFIPTRAVTRAAVTKWIEDLERDPNCSKAMTEVLHLIQRGPLQVDQNKRLTAKYLSERLAQITTLDCSGDVRSEPQSMANEESESRIVGIED